MFIFIIDIELQKENVLELSYQVFVASWLHCVLGGINIIESLFFYIICLTNIACRELDVGEGKGPSLLGRIYAKSN